MHAPTRCRVTAGPRAVWGVPHWPGDVRRHDPSGETHRGDFKQFPNGTIWNTVQLPEIRAAILLQGDQPAKAVELLASASPYERAYPEAVYLRGLAYLRLHKGVEAAAEFRKIVDHKGASWGSTWLYPNWDCTIRFLTWVWRVAPRSRATRRKPGKRSRTSSHCGRTPTRISRSSRKPRRNTPNCSERPIVILRRTWPRTGGTGSTRSFTPRWNAIRQSLAGNAAYLCARESAALGPARDAPSPSAFVSVLG